MRRAALRSLELPGRNGDPILQSRVICAKCGSRGNKIDVRPNWKEQPTQSSLTGKQMALSALINRARNSGRACRLVAD